MPRAPTTLDVFNAIGEPKRRRVLDVLAAGERPVNALGESLGWPQRQVSKHLGVLKRVGLVSERRVGRQRVYRLNGDRLRPVHEWVKTFERFWEHQLDRIKERAERMAAEQSAAKTDQPQPRRTDRADGDPEAGDRHADDHPRRADRGAGRGRVRGNAGATRPGQ